MEIIKILQYTESVGIGTCTAVHLGTHGDDVGLVLYSLKDRACCEIRQIPKARIQESWSLGTHGDDVGLALYSLKDRACCEISKARIQESWSIDS
jgi:hypothetical protein